MRVAIQVPAPKPAVLLLMVRLTQHPHFSDQDLLDLHAMLLRYPPQVVARSLEQACTELVQQGRGPGFPDNGQLQAYLDLLSGLQSLAPMSQFYPSSAAA